MNVLVWFTTDLRAADHPALARAAATGRVLPVHVVDPALWSRPDRAARQWAFVAEALEDLRRDLAARGAPLVVRVGDPGAVLEGLCRRHGIGRVLCHARPDGGAVARVAARLAAAGVALQTVAEEEGEAPLDAPPTLDPVPGMAPGPVPGARALRLTEDRCPHRQAGGRTAALAALERALAHGFRAGAAALQDPQASETAGLRLSAHLAQGCLSHREVAAALAARGGARAALARLDLRRTALAAGRAAPDLGTGTGTGTGTGPAERTALRALVAGETGVPFLDAALRYLAATGWLNARLRQMVAALAQGPLGLSQAAAGAALARLCTDYDPALFWPALAAAGQGSVPDPLRLGQRLDPAGAFLRAWLPELAGVPAAHLHAPWRWEGARGLIGHRYPEALISPAPFRPPTPRRPAATARQLRLAF